MLSKNRFTSSLEAPSACPKLVWKILTGRVRFNSTKFIARYFEL